MKYYEWHDGWFTYYINVKTGEKKLHLDEDDEVVPWIKDDFVGETYEYKT